MKFVGRIAAIICLINTVVGTVMSWLAVGIVIVCFTVVVQRYVFAVSHVWLQDLYIWLNGAMFTAVAGFALLRDNHVRVDIFYRDFTPRQKAWVNTLGGIVFLLPLCVMVVAMSWGYVADAWAVRESSPEPGGIPLLYLLKTLLPLMAINLAIAGCADILRGAALLVRGETL